MSEIQARFAESTSRNACEKVLRCIIEFVERCAPEIRCCVLIADHSAGVLRIGSAPNLPPAFVEAVDGIPIRVEEAACGTAAARRALVVVSDINSSPLWRNYREPASTAGLAACWSMPLLTSARDLIGTFAMYITETRAPRASELELISVAASLAETAIQPWLNSELQRANEIGYREVVDKSTDPVIAHVQGRLVFVNEAARALLQIEEAKVVENIYLWQFFSEDLRSAVLAHHTGRLTTQIRVGDGSLLRMEMTAARLTLDHQPATVLIMRDLNGPATLNRLALEGETRLLEQLAFDLHDGVGQQLTGMSLLLRALGNATISSLPSLTDDFKLVSDLTSKCISDIRVLAASMAPVTLERVGLAGALRVIRQKAESIYGLTAQISIQPSAGWTLEFDDANHLFRIVQEAIGNVARHAQAKLVEIDGRDENSTLVLTVADDGIGITDAAFGAEGLGLRSMRHRAALIKATLAIRPRIPRGTIVEIRYPYPIGAKRQQSLEPLA